MACSINILNLDRSACPESTHPQQAPQSDAGRERAGPIGLPQPDNAGRPRRTMANGPRDRVRMLGPRTPATPRCAACARSSGDLTKSLVERLSRGPRSPPSPSPRSIARVRLSDNLTRTASAFDLYGFRSPPSPRPVVHRRLCDNLTRNPDDVFALHGPRSAPSPRPVTRTRLSDNLERNPLRYGPDSAPSPRPVARQRPSENLARGATVELREPSLAPITPKEPGENLTGDPAWGPRNARTSTSTLPSDDIPIRSGERTDETRWLAIRQNRPFPRLPDSPVVASVRQTRDQSRPLGPKAPRAARSCAQPAPRPLDPPSRIGYLHNQSSRDRANMLLRLAAVPSRPLPRLPEDPVPADIGISAKGARKERTVPGVVRNSDIHRLIADVGGLEVAEEKAILKEISGTTIRRLSRFRRATVVCNNIPEDTGYTRLPRGVVNRRALDEAGVQFVEVGFSVVLFRLLTRDETKVLVNRPRDIRSVVAVEPSQEEETARQSDRPESSEFLL